MPQGGAVVIASLGIWSRLMIGYPRPKQKETRVTTADLLTKLFSRPDQKRPRQAFFTYLPYSTFRPRATRGQLAAQLQAPRVQRGLSDHPKTSNPSLMCCWPKVWWGAADSPGAVGPITGGAAAALAAARLMSSSYTLSRLRTAARMAISCGHTLSAWLSAELRGSSALK